MIIGLATIEAVLSALLLFVPGAASRIDGDGPQAAKEQVRLKLGRWLAVALEFELERFRFGLSRMCGVHATV